MQKRKRKYLLSILIIGSIFTLSLKDTLEVAHAFLHAIPNPFHQHEVDAFHHHNVSRQSFFSYGNHKHSLEDHVHSAKKDKHNASSQKDKSEKLDLKKSLKTNLFVQDMGELRFFFSSYLKSNMLNSGISFFNYLHSSSPTPPPDKA